jgi:cytochrome c-type biogenesis protein CcmH
MNQRIQRLLRLFPLAMVLTVLFAWAPRVAAQSPQPTPSDNDVNRVAKQLFCPVCENVPLDVCPTQACAEWREVIREKLGEGWSDLQVKDYFALQYGDRVLNEPPLRGLNWLVYLLPPLFLVGGGVLLFSVLARMRKAPIPVPTEEPLPGVTTNNADPYLSRVEEELKKQI